MNEILTPRILQTIIICCTIIILGIIGVVAYGIKKRGQRNWASYVFTASVFLTIGIAIFSLCYLSVSYDDSFIQEICLFIPS
jgi:putative effector of murein hydrolase